MTKRHTTRALLLARVLGAMMTAAPSMLVAQVSLATVVDLAERNSTPVRLAETDVQKANAALAQSKDPFVPSLNFGSGLPAFPAVGFTGGGAIDFERNRAVARIQSASEPIHSRRARWH
jgi:outer membrane protein TolC